MNEENVEPKEEGKNKTEQGNKKDEYSFLTEKFADVAKQGIESYQEYQPGREVEGVNLFMGSRHGVVVKTDQRGIPTIMVSRTDLDPQGNPKTQRFFMGLRTEASTLSVSCQTVDLLGRLDTTVKDFDVSSSAHEIVKKSIRDAQDKGERKQKELDETEKPYFPPLRVNGQIHSIFAEDDKTLDLNEVTDLVVTARQTVKKSLGSKLDTVDVMFFKTTDASEYADTQENGVDLVLSRVGLVIDAKTKNGSRAFASIRGSGGGLEVLKRFEDDPNKSLMDIVVNLANKVSKEATDLDKAQTSTFLGSSCPVILSPLASGVLGHESLGHPAEADIILENKEKKNVEVNLKTRIGGKVFESSDVNIIDDGRLNVPYGEKTIRNTFGATLIDEHGTASQTTILVENGIQVGVLISRYEMNEIVDGIQEDVKEGILNRGLTGNVRSENYGHKPIVRMTNTYILPNEKGSSTLESMAAKIPKNKKGVYVDTVQGGWVQPDTGDFQIIGNLSYLIENGQVIFSKPIKNVRISGNIKKVPIKEIGSIKTVKESFSGYCGKNNQSVPVEGVGPIIYIEEASITSSSPHSFIEEYEEFRQQMKKVHEGKMSKENVYISSVAEVESDSPLLDHSSVCMVMANIGIDNEMGYLVGSSNNPEEVRYDND